MTPIKSKRYDGIYGAPKGYEDSIGGLPYYREKFDEYNDTIYSVWELEEWERQAIADGANVLVGQVGEPIRAMSVQIAYREIEQDG